MGQEVETFVEVGPGRVLAGLLKKILPADYPAKVYNVANMKQLERFLKENWQYPLRPTMEAPQGIGLDGLS